MNPVQWFNSLILCSSFSSSKYYFPEEILIQILHRIPADQVLLFKTVCRRWKSIILSPYFVNLHSLHHLRITKEQPLTHHNNNTNNPISIFVFVLTKVNNPPQIFGIYEGGFGFGLSSMIMRRKMRVRRICLPELKTHHHHHHQAPFLRLLGSCDGLLMFDEVGFTSVIEYPKRILILNPVTRERRVIGYPKSPAPPHGYVCAFFFDRFQQEHNLLHVSTKTEPSPEVYHIFSLTHQSAWRRIPIASTTPSSSSSLGHANYVPSCMHTIPPVIVADALHWIIDDCEFNDQRGVLFKTVMALKIETKEIYYFPHPVVTTTTPNIHYNECDICGFQYRGSCFDKIQLIEKKGDLCLCHIYLIYGVIELWILEEYGNWSSWVRRFKFKISHRDFDYFNGYYLTGPGSTILSFPDQDVIAIKWNSGLIYLYHLNTHKLSRIEDVSIYRHHSMYREPWAIGYSMRAKYRFVAFNKTLLSPNKSF